MDWTYILTTALGSGGLASFITWLCNRELYKAKAIRDREGIWKEMYESTKEATVKLSYDNEQLFQEIHDLKRLVVKMVDCKYYTQCPARHELQDYKRKHFNAPRRQPSMEQKGFRYARDNPIEHCEVDNPDGQPP